MWVSYEGEGRGGEGRGGEGRGGEGRGGEGRGGEGRGGGGEHTEFDCFTSQFSGREGEGEFPLSDWQQYLSLASRSFCGIALIQS